VPDLRNSKVLELVAELRDFGLEPLLHDPLADAAEVAGAAGAGLSAGSALSGLDLLILAVDHDSYLGEGAALAGRLKPGGVLMDIRSALDPKSLPEGLAYWSL
jgi:UDP-N-acetyl-D-galactosamine dehydrogenase